MKLLLTLFFTFLSLLDAQIELKSNYMVADDYVLLSDIVQTSNKNIKLYKIDKNRHSLRIKTKQLLQKLHSLGYKEISSKHNYTQFSKTSPINTQKIEQYLNILYKKHYRDIQIQKIVVIPRSYLAQLPADYAVSTNKKAFLSDKGIVSIKTNTNKKIFFNYQVQAKTTVVVAKEDIAKESELSILNSKKKGIILKKFRALPLQKIEQSSFQVKHKIKKGSIITIRDVVPLLLVKRGSSVNVVIKDANIAISFSAKAKQSGRLGDTITVVNSQGKRLKAVVTAKNSAEIR